MCATVGISGSRKTKALAVGNTVDPSYLPSFFDRRDLSMLSMAMVT